MTAFHDALMKLRPQLAAAAQRAYDVWDQGGDDDLNGGGICQDIAEAMRDVLTFAGYDATTLDASVGEQHVWCVAYDDREAYEVDIPYDIYESGSGYSWTKIDGVIFRPSDVLITATDRDGVDEEW